MPRNKVIIRITMDRSGLVIGYSGMQRSGMLSEGVLPWQGVSGTLIHEGFYIVIVFSFF